MRLQKRLLVAGTSALAVAGALIGWGASQQANYVWHAEHKSAENAHYTNNYIRYRCIPLPPLAERDCVIDARREQRSYERDEHDLYAQKASAFWTFLMGSAAIIGMVLSAVGVFLVFFTFGETRRANRINMRENARSTRRAIVSAQETSEALDAANKTAEAAAGQVAIAQETAYRDLRAYISVQITVKQVSDIIFSGEIIVENAGKTPAKIEIFFNSWIGAFPVHFLPTDAPAPFRHFQHDPFANARSRVIAPWFYPWGDVNQSEAIKALAESTDLSFYLHGRVEFVDFAKHRRVLHFAFRKHGVVKNGQPFPMIALPWGNQYEDIGEAD